MRLTAILLFAISMQVSARGFSQITLHETNTPLKKVFKKLEKQSGYNFFCTYDLLQEAGNVSVAINNVSLQDALNFILKSKGLTYTIARKTIVIKRTEIPTVSRGTEKINTEPLFAVIKGRVTDANGTPVEGVSVQVKNGSGGVSTNANGEFTIDVPQNSSGILVFTHVNMEPGEVHVKGQTNIAVTLEARESKQDEIVVVGYGTQRRKNVTGAVSQIGAEDITVVPSANSTKLVGGRLMGLITKDNGGQPGADNVQLSLRGYGEPLYIVDGLPSSLARIDPNEIETISALKDASSAVYGARAGNGVILITTKRGKNRPPQITYTGNISFDKPTAFLKQVNAGEYAELRREASLNFGLDPGEFTEEVVQSFKEGIEPGFRSYSWLDALLKNNGVLKQHNVNVSGGGNNVRYFAAVGLTGQEGIFKSDDYNYKRYNIRLNLDVDVTKNISAIFDIAYRHNITDAAGDMNLIWNQIETAQPRYSPYLPDPAIVPYSGFSERNPVAVAEKDIVGYNRTATSYLNGKIGLKYKIPYIDGLAASAELLIDKIDIFTKNFSRTFETHSYDWTTEVYTFMGRWGTDDRLSESVTRGYQLYPRFSLNYDKKIGAHTVGGMVLYEYIESGGNSLSAFRRGIISPDVQQLYAGIDLNQNNSGGAALNTRASYVSKLSYSFGSKYLVDAILRADASSNFPKSKRWGYFPGISAAWRISEEKFMPSAGVLSDLKLRLSYGQSGNDNTSQFSYLSGFEIGDAHYIIGGQANLPIYPTGLANPNITWEQITNYNLGLDVGMWGNKLLFEANLFYRTRSGILATQVRGLPSTFGASLPPTNLNAINNRGIELGINYKTTINKVVFSAVSNLILSRQKWEKLDEIDYTDPDDIRLFKRTGSWTNISFGYVSDGLFMTQEEIDKLGYIQDQNNNSTLRPGDIRFKDINNDGKIDYRDQQEIGLGTFPEFTGSLILGAEWKGIGINLMFQGASRFNFNIAGASGSVRAPFSNESIPYNFQYKYRWQPDPGNPDVNINPNALLPAASFGVTPNNNRTSDFWLKDASYLRLKNLNISYDLPLVFVQKAGFKDFQIYVAGTNLFTLSRLGIYKNAFDPEGVSGNYRVYPLIKSYTFGIRVTL